MASTFARSIGHWHLTARGWGVLLGAAASLLAANWWALGQLNYIGWLLTGLLVFASVYVAIGHSRVEVERRFRPTLVHAGAPLTVTMILRNRSSVPSMDSTWSDRLPAEFVGRARGELSAMGPRQTSTRDYQGRVTVRGVHHIGPLAITMPDPFGLIERQHWCGDPTEVLVLPKMIGLPPLAASLAGANGLEHAAQHRAGPGVDDLVARLYVPGDEMRHLHWKATARRGQLMVRQVEHADDPNVTVVLNADAASYGGRRTTTGVESDKLPAFEWAVSQTASMCASIIDTGYELNLFAVGESPRGGPVVAGESRSIEDILVDLAHIKPAYRSGADPAALADELVTRPPRLLIAVLGRPDEQAARRWAELAPTGLQSIAFVDAHTTDVAVEILESARWSCRRCASADELYDTWRSIDAGLTHVAR